MVVNIDFVVVCFVCNEERAPKREWFAAFLLEPRREHLGMFLRSFFEPNSSLPMVWKPYGE